MPPAKTITKEDLSALKTEIIQQISVVMKKEWEEMEVAHVNQIVALEEQIKTLSTLLDEVSNKSSLPDIEPFLKTRMLGGAMDRKELYRMAFTGILHATVSTSMNILGRYIPSEENEQMARFEFDKIARLTDIAIEQIEKQYSPE